MPIDFLLLSNIPSQALPYPNFPFVAILLHSLDQRLKNLRTSALAESSRKTRSAQWRLYKQFCQEHELQALPASTSTVCRYIASLHSRGLQYNTILNYAASITTLHHATNVQGPDMSHFSIKEALAGVKRTREELPNQREALLPHHLLAINQHLHSVSSRYRQTFWTACLLAFHTMVRSANLFADRKTSPRHLTLQSVIPTNDGYILNFPALKNERFLKKTVPIPITRCQTDDTLCAAPALQRSITGRTDQFAPLLIYTKNRKDVALTSAKFNRTLREVLRRAGFSASRFSVHSFRRGAATYASQTGISADSLKAQGN